ncbi:MAG: ParB N-terminal domain-containing protein [Pelagimonas sp.]|uniref:ParB N-terminal domain-containing protein n=1 Tax=Pelagimonas sp. TaxID=2073170 RepID=UPI003D6B6B6F
MVPKILPTITELPVSEIEFGERLRPVSDAGVDALIASINELGVMKDPIHVRKIKRSRKIVLLAGGHRLTAAIKLDWDAIKVTCWECNDDFAKLMEIDDNLAGAELTALDTAVFLAERKRVYERLYPEAKAATGADLVAKRWNTDDRMSLVSFATTTAEKLGCSKRQVERLVQAGTALSSDNIQSLRNSERPIIQNDLFEIAKIGEDAERNRVVTLLSEGQAKKAAEARKMFKAEQGKAPAPILANEDKCYLRLKDAWDRAPAAAIRMMVEEREAELVAAIKKYGGKNG